MSAPQEKTSQWDYIIVGSGAGGGPLAARLALKGYRILVLEAGVAGQPMTSEIPAFHAAASEDPEISWEFFVKHYSDETLQKQDSKYETDKGGIFYPRAAGIGGCTIHNAQITIAGPTRGWDEIAELTGDATWRGDNMRKYFMRMEQCDYLPKPADETDRNSNPGRHGFNGWLHSSWLDLRLGLEDPQLIKVLISAAQKAALDGVVDFVQIADDLVRGRPTASLDPNDAITQQQSPEGVRLVPMATNHGKRNSPRDFLLAVRDKLAKEGGRGQITIQTDTVVTKLLWETVNSPQVKGVEVLRCARAYRAAPNPSNQNGIREELYCNEVILCGGAFNTPQLLMLSGIGPKADLEKLPIECLVDLPCVGANLQDRNEVTVVTEMNQDFPLLRNAAFGNPDVPDDPALDEWKASKTGLYATNGAVLCIQKRSSPSLPDPDLFIFGLPGEFRGYKQGYSKVIAQHKNRFTWVVLKAYTSNRGKVSLVTTDPLDLPDINFMFFEDGKNTDNEDMKALVAGVKFIRSMNQFAAPVVKAEIWPGPAINDDTKLKEFIMHETWGHHACGTCKIGADDDPTSVLDSRFRVRGVRGLRVVDASVFPNIPGMFIVSHIYMISEKAADVIDEDAHGGPDNPLFPKQLKELENAAIAKRRDLADDNAGNTAPAEGKAIDPLRDTFGLALSGGGIRSATFCLGVLQGLARHKVLRAIDYLSTVSGGGYIGSFLGRFYTRSMPSGLKVAEHVEKELINPDSPQIDWLRTHANYIAPPGANDTALNLGIYLRSFLTLQFVLSTFLFTIFGLANIIRFGLAEVQDSLPSGLSLPGPADLPLGYILQEALGQGVVSPWFMLVEVMLLTLVVPLMLAYWLASQDEPDGYQPSALIVAFLVAAVFLVGGLYGMGKVSVQPLFALVALMFSFFFVEKAWFQTKQKLRGSGVDAEDVRVTLPRAILTTWLGKALFGTFAAVAFTVADTAGQFWYHKTQTSHPAVGLAQLGAVLAALMPILTVASSLVSGGKRASASTTGLFNKLKSAVLPWLIAVIALLVWATLLSYVSHWAFSDGKQFIVGLAATGFTFAISFVLAWSIHLINRTSLQAVYASRLGRTYLGATNPARANSQAGKNITEDMPGDDLPLSRYAPHEFGGPIHIINTTVSQTTDRYSGRPTRDRPGEVVAVTKFGISIGLTSHARWGGDTMLIPIPNPLGEPHPIHQATKKTEGLSLRNWIAISGAAISAAQGSATNIGATLLMTISNLRTGYWWDSGAKAERDASLQRSSAVMKALDCIPRFFLPQFLLLYELMGYYAGPWAPYWYLSDGGFFENLAVYELLRRRVRTIVCCDATQDDDYVFEDLGNLVRKARIDFDARITFLTATALDGDPKIPPAVKPFLGELKNLKPAKDHPFSRVHAALALIHYGSDPKPASVFLYVKLGMTGHEQADVLTYRAIHPSFPHDSTGDQFFDEAQWESYRALGEDAVRHLLTPGPKGRFWLLEYL